MAWPDLRSNRNDGKINLLDGVMVLILRITGSGLIRSARVAYRRRFCKSRTALGASPRHENHVRVLCLGSSLWFRFEVPILRRLLSTTNSNNFLWSGIFQVVTTQTKTVLICGQDFFGFWGTRTKNVSDFFLNRL